MQRRRSPRLSAATAAVPAATATAAPTTPVQDPIAPPLAIADASRILRVLDYYVETIKSIHSMKERIDCVIHTYEFLLQTVPYPMGPDSVIGTWLCENKEVLTDYVDHVDIPLSKKIRLHILQRHVERMFSGHESVLEAACILAHMKQCV